MVQKPKGGGVFEYAPAIRNARSENYDAVAAVMAGEGNGVIALPWNLENCRYSRAAIPCIG